MRASKRRDNDTDERYTCFQSRNPVIGKNDETSNSNARSSQKPYHSTRANRIKPTRPHASHIPSPPIPPAHQKSMDSINLPPLAPLGVSLLTILLAYGSQLFFHLAPSPPLQPHQRIIFNLLVSSLWTSYARACLTDAGRVPPDWRPPPATARSSVRVSEAEKREGRRRRWCGRCEGVKPSRAHHCRSCRRWGGMRCFWSAWAWVENGF